MCERFNPRTECDNFAHIELHHKRYDLGDKNDHGNFASLSEYRRHLEHVHNAVIIVDVFGYDHGVLDIATEIRPYWWQNRWDGGRLGFAWVSKDDIRKNYNVKRVTADLIIKARALIVSEVEEYAAYLRGDPADDLGCTGQDESEVE